MRARVAARRAVLILLASCLTVLVASPAHAAEYRYWSFWYHQDGAWRYATQGPSTAEPADGDVEGFRFAVSTNSKEATTPRGGTDFERICADTEAKAGSKRIALVLDFGTAEDATKGEAPPKPRTACARIPEDGTSAEALAAVAKPLRYGSDALLCAVAGYPRSGCGEQVSAGGDAEKAAGGDEEKAAPDARKTDDDGPSVGLIAGVAAVLALGGAALWQARRRRG
ncbi:SCO2322 family protein [Streptomyces luteolus]|uniref:SCO2322 family protein n=1 Tax=Streptomyces luteolus TaxID=3043615 RepID=A0ABT6SZ46_9ACTN|nr:SCO2322 family protein [Streptomyces sp. B-S-A12]MDI3419922.1 SCO2322 family protein [Streptomyces sp. B-S-A12]